jgi:hypothetical protein
LRQNKDKIDRVGARYRQALDLFDGAGLISVFGSTFEDRLQTRGVLQLLVRAGVIGMRLEARDRMVGPQLSTHLRENLISMLEGDNNEKESMGRHSQFRVVFILPKFTSRHTMAI